MTVRSWRTNDTAAADRDRGEATAQLVILTPLLVLLVFLGVQAAIYFHAANVAAAAAASGAATGSGRSAGPGNVAADALRTVSDLDGHVTASPVVSDANGYVVVSVSVEVPRIVPFFPGSVARTAREPKERFVPESQR